MLLLAACPSEPASSCAACAAGEVCLAGQCLPAACGDRPCHTGQACVKGACVDSVCFSVTCPAGQTCAKGSCYPTDCTAQTCLPGELCWSEELCRTSLCQGVACAQGETCADGRCLPEGCAGVVCPTGAACENGRCQDVRCVGVVCGSGTVCADGRCLPVACQGIACEAGFGCMDGQCVDARCVGLRCPDGSACVEGTCLAPDAGVGLPDAAEPGPDAAVAGPDAGTPDASPPVVPLAGVGVWRQTTSELKRTLATSVSRTTFTFATWYKTSDLGTMLLCAGVAQDRQSFVWSGTSEGTPFFQHGAPGMDFAAGPHLVPWPYRGKWVHLVLSVDLTRASEAQRVRWFADGAETALTSGSASPFPQSLQLYLGDKVVHTLGNKYEGSFDWTGSLADTYLVWGHALEPSSFVAVLSPGIVRSIVYSGPVTAESVHFEYSPSAGAGHNSFAGQPNWSATAVTLSSADLPY